MKTKQKPTLEVLIGTPEAFRTIVCADLVSSADLGTEDERDTVMNMLYLPIMRRHLFHAHHGGIADYDPRFGNIQPDQFRCKMTLEHKGAYIRELQRKCAEFRALVENNKRVNLNYVTPTFDREQAIEFAAEAFQESFRVARDSYSNAAKVAYKMPEEVSAELRKME